AQLVAALNEILGASSSGFLAGVDGDRVTFTRMGAGADAAMPIEVLVGSDDTGPGELGFSGNEVSVLLSADEFELTLGAGVHDVRYEIVGLQPQGATGLFGDVLSWEPPAGTSVRFVYPDIDAALARLDSLRVLSLAHSGIVDISALATLEELEQLYLEGNAIRDITPLVGLAIVDDGDDDFTASGDFQRSINPVAGAFEVDYRFAPPTDASTTAAEWTFGDLNDGTYALFATWVHHETRTREAGYTLSDVNGAAVSAFGANGEPLDVLQVDQQLAPAGAMAGGRPWQQLGYVTVTGGVLRVTLHGVADGIVVADAIRLERVAVVTAEHSAPALGQVRGEDNTVEFIVNGESLGQITYSESATQDFTSPQDLADLLNARLDDAGLDDRIRAGYDVARNRMTFLALEVPNDESPLISLRLEFLGVDRLGFAPAQTAGPVLPSLERIVLTANPLDSRAQTVVAPRLNAAVAVVTFDPNAAPQLTSPGPQSSAAATGAVRLDGADSMTVPHGASLNQPRFLTVEVTFTVEEFGSEWMPLVYKGNGTGTSGRSYTVWIHESGAVYFTTADSRFGQTHVNTPAGSVAPDETHHFAGVMDRQTGRMFAYLDGNLVDQKNIPFVPAIPPVRVTVPIFGTITLVPGVPEQRFDAVTTTQPLLIGASLESNATFQGVIDELR
ncbi:MAG TPA: LamG-like jellyroll fold domain-containing protein, partial [Gammaproteobacteria bacterium]|nr:LamG-like jellyroll fold domain-containing protein [Gammaproteobacteria bacterium]